MIFDAVDKAGYTGACGLEYTPTMDSEISLREFRRIYLGGGNPLTDVSGNL